MEVRNTWTNVKCYSSGKHFKENMQNNKVVKYINKHYHYIFLWRKTISTISDFQTNLFRSAMSIEYQHTGAKWTRNQPKTPAEYPSWECMPDTREFYGNNFNTVFFVANCAAHPNNYAHGSRFVVICCALIQVIIPIFLGIMLNAVYTTVQKLNHSERHQHINAWIILEIKPNPCDIFRFANTKYHKSNYKKVLTVFALTVRG